MSSWLTFVIGVILGLLIGWLIELFYRRRRDAQRDLEPAAATAPTEWAVPTRSAPAEAAVAGVAAAPGVVRLEAVADAERQPDWPELAERVSEVAAATDETPVVNARIADAMPVVDEAPTVGAAPVADEVRSGEGLSPAAIDALAAPNPADARDKLIVIEGIGPVYEKKLNAAGINTFRQLVAAGPEQLRDIIQPQNWQRLNFDEWIEQARLLDEGRHAELKALQDRLFSRKKPQ